MKTEQGTIEDQLEIPAQVRRADQRREPFVTNPGLGELEPSEPRNVGEISLFAE